MSTIVRHKQGEVPPLTAAQRAQLRALAGQPDSGIDYSDIPPLTDEFWARAKPNPFFKPTKTQTSVRIDTDVLLWLKREGRGWQKRLNERLRQSMLRERAAIGQGQA